MSSVLIHSGHVIDPANTLDGIFDILVKNGKIEKVAPKISEKAETTIDAKGKLVTPGLIDIQVHFREPGFEGKETIETGLRTALKGGVTSVVTMPNTNPVTDNALTVQYQLAKAKAADLGNLYVAGAITKGEEGDALADIAGMQQAGAVAVTDDGRDVQDAGLLKKAMEYCKTFGIVLMSHCEVESLSGEGVMHEGTVSTKLGLPGIPAIAEDLAVLKNLALAEVTGAKVHILHVSTKGAVEMIRHYQQKGVNVTAETCPQYFCLTDEICDGYNTFAKMYPPIRSAEHRTAIVEGLKDGTLSVITTDHAPHKHAEKLQPFQQAAKGSVGLETSFALGYTHLVKTGLLTLAELVATMSVHAAKVVSIPKGTLSVGASADISIFYLEREWSVKGAEMESKGSNCVFEGMKVFGKADTVLVDGVIKMQHGNIIC